MNKELKKAAAAVLFAATVISSLAGCGSREAASQVTSAESTAVPQTEAAVQTKAAETSAQTSPSQAEVKTETQTQVQSQTETAALQETPGFLHPEVTSVYGGLSEKETYYSKARYEYAKVLLPEKEAEKYGELQSALLAYNQEMENGYQEVIERLSATYDEVTAGRPEEKDQLQLCDEQNAYIVRSDTGLLSILTFTYANYGGAHPDHYYRSANFETESGKRLRLSDVVTDMEKLAELADEKLKAEYPEIYSHFYSAAKDAIAAADTADSQMAWTAGYEELTLYFNPYCLGAYAMGEQIISIYYDEIPELFTETAVHAPESYFLPVAEGVEPAVDAAGTGKRERIRILEEQIEDYGVYKYTVRCGDRACLMDDGFYHQTSYLVKANGQYYLYMFATSDNDYIILSVVDLRTMVRNADLMFNASVPYTYYGYENNEEGYIGWYTKAVCTDPEFFALSTRVNYMMTQDGTRNYYVGMNGWPAAREEYYSLKAGPVLLVKQRITADIVSEDGTITGTEVLEPGTFLFFVRTDDASFVDLQKTEAENVDREVSEWREAYNLKTPRSADWSEPVYRIREDKSSWPYTVDKIPEDDVFGGIQYAG